jgi:tRNA (guanine37-N1)-methyltransferase
VPRFDVITLMPELFEPHLKLGVTRRAFETGAVQVRLWPLRDHAEGAYRRVDDRPFGGGPGMVMLAEPLHRCIEAIRADRGGDPSGGAAPEAPLIHFTPTGRPLNQSLVRELARGPGALLLCGRYEGVDQRVLDRHQALNVSLGDFVLSGGDLPALVLLDAVARLQPGVLHDSASHEQDSFEGDGLLEGPHYSRPEVWPQGPEGTPVPPVLLSGHHADIERWRREQSLRVTAANRPDLIEAAREAGHLSKRDLAFLALLGSEVSDR